MRMVLKSTANMMLIKMTTKIIIVKLVSKMRLKIAMEIIMRTVLKLTGKILGKSEKQVSCILQSSLRNFSKNKDAEIIDIYDTSDLKQEVLNDGEIIVQKSNDASHTESTPIAYQESFDEMAFYEYALCLEQKYEV